MASAASPCPACGAALASPLACETCGALLEVPRGADPFALLGETPRFDLDDSALRKRLLALSRRVHPDFFAASPTDRARAEENTALLNKAHEVLADPFRRADWLVRHLGGPAEEESRDMPPEFLAEVLEWNEAIDEARSAPPDSPERRGLETLGAALEAERTACNARIAALLVPLPAAGATALKDARRELNAARYLGRALRQIRELRLDRAHAR